MLTIQARNRQIAFLKACLECSVYISPLDPGLTHAEIVEAGSRANLQPGEILDAMSQVTPAGAAGRLMPNPSDVVMWLIFTHPEEPDYRDPLAFDFVFEEMHQAARIYGAQNARLERSVIVERGAATGLRKADLQVAVTIMLLNGILLEQDGILQYARGREGYASPSAQQAQQRPNVQPRRNGIREQAYAAVKDVIARRTDGRPKSAEPFEAFADALDSLGYTQFRLWWSQIVAELRQASTQTAPVTATVLSAALVEGALTFVVKHARSLDLGVMGSKTFADSATKWRLDDLLASAGYGNDAAILDKAAQMRSGTLIQARQRIHAGRMLDEFPGGPPDLQPEKAREALLTAELVVRSILEWLQRYPSKN